MALYGYVYLHYGQIVLFVDKFDYYFKYPRKPHNDTYYMTCDGQYHDYHVNTGMASHTVHCHGFKAHECREWGNLIWLS